MDEITDPKVDPTPQGQDLPKGEESNSKEEPKHYTEQEHRKAIEDAIAQYGDKVKREKIDPITQERDTFKSQAEKVANSLKDTENRIADLESDLEQAISDDAELRDIAKIKKDLRSERDRAREESRAEKDSLAEEKRLAREEREANAALVVEAQAYKFTRDLEGLVIEYAGDVSTNLNKLKAVCERAGITTKEGAEAIAETFLSKKVVEPDLLNDSGVTSGGKGGRKPTLVELQSASPAEFDKKVKDGTWVL